jgi:hypothetical protein
MAQIGVDREGFRPSYRPARRQEAALDPDMKRLAMIAGAIGGVIALVFAGSSLMGHRHHGIPVIEAEAGPVRIKPENAGGMQVTGADLGLGIGTTQALAPAAEQPQINALRAQIHAMSKELARQAAETAQVAKLAEAANAPKLAQASPAKIAAAPLVQRASAQQRVAVPESPTSVSFKAAPPPAPPEPKIAAPGGPSVQLAAFTDEAAARAGWDSLVKKAPDLLGGRTPEITRIQIAGRAMWRLRTDGFGTVAEATSFCAKMRAHGADCAIAAF